MVSRLARVFAFSTVPSEPFCSRSSGGRDGDVIISEGPSPASASSLRNAEPRKGDEPERVRNGILVNLIWLAGLWLVSIALIAGTPSHTSVNHHPHHSRH